MQTHRQPLARVAPAIAVGAQRRQAAGNPGRNLVRHNLHVVRDGNKRSALFLETGPLRLIAVENEQEESHLQTESPAYDARRGAWLRARSEDAVAVYGSSRPTVEAFIEAREAGTLIEFEGEPRRARVTIVDQARAIPIVSRGLERQLRARLNRGEPSVLFLNRRGYAAHLACSGCDHVPRCPRCDIPLVFHKAEDRLVCHYCGHAIDAGKACSGCGGRIVVRRGAGTQAVEEELGRLFPGVRVGRFDTDTGGAVGGAGGRLDPVTAEYGPCGGHHELATFLATGRWRTGKNG